MVLVNSFRFHVMMDKVWLLLTRDQLRLATSFLPWTLPLISIRLYQLLLIWCTFNLQGLKIMTSSFFIYYFACFLALIFFTFVNIGVTWCGSRVLWNQWKVHAGQRFSILIRYVLFLLIRTTKPPLGFQRPRLIPPLILHNNFSRKVKFSIWRGLMLHLEVRINCLAKTDTVLDRRTRPIVSRIGPECIVRLLKLIVLVLIERHSFGWILKWLLFEVACCTLLALTV